MWSWFSIKIKKSKKAKGKEKDEKFGGTHLGLMHCCDDIFWPKERKGERKYGDKISREVVPS